MSEQETPELARILETWQDEFVEQAAAEAENRMMAEALMGRLIALKVDNVRKARQVCQAFSALLDNLERIENRERLMTCTEMRKGQ
jgi:hypothetical protein